METYYIYHIPDFVHKDGSIGKIGCTEEPIKRVKKQGFNHYEILETHTDIYLASNREQELQREYGYPVDSAPYFISRRNWGSRAGKVGGKSRSEKKMKAVSETGKKWGPINAKIATERRRSYKGEGNIKCKITEETAINILTDYMNDSNKYGLFIRLSEKYNTTKRIVQKICKRQTWKHIKPNIN